MHELSGGCHCGNTVANVQLSRPPEFYGPRVCDCEFCSKHGASYLSDPDGVLRICVRDPQAISKYRQGSHTAEFLLCSICGVLVAVTHESDGRTFAAVNSRIFADRPGFAEAVVVSPQRLPVDERVDRWARVWFADVTVLRDQISV